MQTRFSEGQLADPLIADANRVLRKCVHCGFCLATCPTYVLLGDELDSPRGRIYLMKEMLETGGPPAAETVKHIDRCLSCLSCVSTCPSGVDYRRLVDQTRVHIESTFRRPWPDRWLRRFLGWVLVRPPALRIAMSAGALARRFPDCCRHAWRPWRACRPVSPAARRDRLRWPLPRGRRTAHAGGADDGLCPVGDGDGDPRGDGARPAAARMRGGGRRRRGLLRRSQPSPRR